MPTIERFKNWLSEQNNQYHFARAIKDRATVYFSDELVAGYDIMIAGLPDDTRSIVIQFEMDFEDPEHFIASSSRMWISQAGWEWWYLSRDLEWMIIADEGGRRRYDAHDLIRSKRIDFEFKLEQID